MKRAGVGGGGGGFPRSIKRRCEQKETGFCAAGLLSAFGRLVQVLLGNCASGRGPVR